MPQKTNGMAIGSFVSSMAAIVLGFLCCIPGPIGGVIAIVLGRMARGQIRASGGVEGGAGLATAGEIIGWIVTVLSVFALVGIVGLIVIGNETKNVFQDISNGLASPQ